MHIARLQAWLNEQNSLTKKKEYITLGSNTSFTFFWFKCEVTFMVIMCTRATQCFGGMLALVRVTCVVKGDLRSMFKIMQDKFKKIS
jgi:hypothetical protein